MWDDGQMRDSGYNDLVEHREIEPDAATKPATSREVRGDDPSAVQVTGEQPQLKGTAPPRKDGISWVITLTIAVLLGVAVFVIVRWLR